MVSDLQFGTALTIIAWLGLQAAVFHGKHVTERIARGDYTKGPLANREEDASDE